MTIVVEPRSAVVARAASQNGTGRAIRGQVWRASVLDESRTGGDQFVGISGPHNTREQAVTAARALVPNVARVTVTSTWPAWFK